MPLRYRDEMKGTPCSASHLPQIPIRFRPCRSRPLVDGVLCTLTIELLASVRPNSRMNTNTVPRCTKPTLVVFQAELANPQASIWNIRVLLRERCIIPGLNVELSETDGTYPEAS